MEHAHEEVGKKCTQLRRYLLYSLFFRIHPAFTELNKEVFQQMIQRTIVPHSTIYLAQNQLSKYGPLGSS